MLFILSYFVNGVSNVWYDGLALVGGRIVQSVWWKAYFSGAKLTSFSWSSELQWRYSEAVSMKEIIVLLRLFQWAKLLYEPIPLHQNPSKNHLSINLLDLKKTIFAISEKFIMWTFQQMLFYVKNDFILSYLLEQLGHMLWFLKYHTHFVNSVIINLDMQVNDKSTELKQV